MSKAERTTEQMCEACWMHNDPECGYECRNLQRKCTNNDLIGRGYELAEKDLQWEVNHREEAYMKGFKEGTEHVLKLIREEIERLKEKSADYDDAFMEGYQWCAYDVSAFLDKLDGKKKEK